MEFMRSHPPFDRLSQSELQRIEGSLEIGYLPKDARALERGGRPSEFLYFIRKGSVRLERDGLVEQLLEEGDCFGFPSLIGRAAPHADAVAVEDTLLYQVPRSVFDWLLGTPAFSEFFLADLAERLRRAAVPTDRRWDLALPARSLVKRPLVRIGGGATVGEAARLMKQQQVSSLIVDGPGILTDRDLRTRVLAEGLGPETPVSQVASQPLLTLPADATLYEALLFLLDHGVHHAPLEKDGALVGMLSHADLLQSPFTIDLSESGLGRYGSDVTAAVASLAAGGLQALQIARVVARLNDTLLRRLLLRAESELGPPPSPYAFIVYGSEGRGEQALLTDQDNAIVSEIESPYFAELAKRVVNGLLAASFPPCRGGFMATRWNQPIDRWLKQFRGYLEKPEPEALRDAATFFDFRAVHGELDLSPLHEVIDGAARRPLFLAHLARAAVELEPPLSLLHQIRDKDGLVDVKAGGLLPIVGLARLYALEAGSRTRGTLDRLQAAAGAGKLSREGAATLGEAFHFLLGLRLRAQLAEVQSGDTADNSVRPETLTPLERKLLKDTFLAIREVQRATKLRFQTERLA